MPSFGDLDACILGRQVLHEELKNVRLSSSPLLEVRKCVVSEPRNPPQTGTFPLQIRIQEIWVHVEEKVRLKGNRSVFSLVTGVR